MAIYRIEEESLVAIADEVRTLAGSQEEMSVSDMVGNLGEANSEVSEQSDLIAEIASALEGKAAGGGGNYEYEDAIVTGTLSSYFNDRVTTIGSNVFNSCANLTTVSFPICTSIGPYAFYTCKSLTTISFPIATTIGSHAFGQCSDLTSANFPSVSSIGTYAFNSCIQLTTANFPAATTIGVYAFAQCYSLTTISFPVVTRIGSNAFDTCTQLTTVDFPACTTIGSYAFYSCTRLTTANFPAATTINIYAFKSCKTLSSLTLTGPSVCTLSNSNAFASTPYAGYSASFSGTPYIYVPASLISAYQSATNWTYFSSYFSAIEGEDELGEDDMPIT